MTCAIIAGARVWSGQLEYCHHSPLTGAMAVARRLQRRSIGREAAPLRRYWRRVVELRLKDKLRPSKRLAAT
jgi:hypothetical protein